MYANSQHVMHNSPPPFILLFMGTLPSNVAPRYLRRKTSSRKKGIKNTPSGFPIGAFKRGTTLHSTLPIYARNTFMRTYFPQDSSRMSVLSYWSRFAATTGSLNPVLGLNIPFFAFEVFIFNTVYIILNLLSSVNSLFTFYRYFFFLCYVVVN